MKTLNRESVHFMFEYIDYMLLIIKCDMWKVEVWHNVESMYKH